MGINYGSAQTMVHDDLGYRKICARWIPKFTRGADVTSCATEKFLFRKKRETRIMIPEVHGCTV